MLNGRGVWVHTEALIGSMQRRGKTKLVQMYPGDNEPPCYNCEQ